jgi:hypothetical protein
MERRKCLYLFLLIAFSLVFYSCHPRRLSDIKPNMTKEEVASLWGRTPVVTYKTVDGKTVETWEYHFASSNSLCSITFSEDRVRSAQCRPLRSGGYSYPAQSGQTQAGPPPGEQNLVREGAFAMELAAVLKMGEVTNEAEAENKLASAGIAPKNGWIADYPVTPQIIEQLQNAVGEAADSGKISMNREEAVRAFQDLTASLKGQEAGVEPPPASAPYPGPYYYPYYYYPYPPYPYPFGGYYRFYTPYRRHWR